MIESAILNRESCGSELRFESYDLSSWLKTLRSCDSDWRFWDDFLRFYFTAIRLTFVIQAAEP